VGDNGCIALQRPVTARDNGRFQDGPVAR